MRRLRRLGPCALVLALAGCVPGPEPAFDNDPLLGGRPLPRPGALAAAPKPPAAPGTAPPTTTGPVGPAALASAAPPADASALRIGQAPAPVALASDPRDADPWRSAPPPVGAALQPPQPINNDAPGRPGAVLAPPTVGGPVPAPSAGTDPYEQLQDQLARRGVLFQSLEGPDDRGVWRFSCGVPSRNDPNAVHRVEVSAAGDHGLAAIHAAIEQIDRDAP